MDCSKGIEDFDIPNAIHASHAPEKKVVKPFSSSEWPTVSMLAEGASQAGIWLRGFGMLAYIPPLHSSDNTIEKPVVYRSLVWKIDMAGSEREIYTSPPFSFLETVIVLCTRSEWCAPSINLPVVSGENCCG